MTTFRTNDGREWKLAVNVGSIKRCLEDTGLRLTDLFASDAKVSEFFSDDIKFAEVLWSLVRLQAEAAGNGFDEFLSAIDGTVIESAAEALLSAVVDFSQEPRRTLLRRVLEKMKAARERLATEGFADANRSLEALNFEAILKTHTATQPIHLNSATNSPDASE
jgi:hypothetical protein